MSQATAPTTTATIFMAMSLDGRIAGPGGDLSFLETVQIEGSNEDYGYGAFFAGVDALVMGRATYEVVLGFGAWPYRDTPVVVLSHQLVGQPPPRPSVRFVAGDVRQIAATLRAEGLTQLYVDGGGVARAFLAAGLVDAFVLSVVPTVLGSGPRLFDDGPEGNLPRSRWRLVSSQGFGSGLVQLRYARSA